MSKASILIIDDNQAYLDVISSFLKKQDFNVASCNNPFDGLALIKEQYFDILLTDYNMPGMDGLTLIKEIRKQNPEIAMIAISGHGTINTAVNIIQAGALEFIEKPVDLEALLKLIDKILKNKLVAVENQELEEKLQEVSSFKYIATSSAMVEVSNLVTRIAPSNATVLIEGESGTGKEVIAKALHFASLRKNKPFIAVNCAALVENLLESELFGHVKGAFTGAYENRKGKFEEANGGTLMLDEIGEMSLITQSKLLRILQEKTFTPVGGNKDTKVNVRVIAATNRKLQDAVKDKLFREDLYYRLNVLPIVIPPLREHKEDIIPLIDHFVSKYTTEYAKPVEGVTAEAKKLLLHYDYPGNIRELENIIARAIVMTRTKFIDAEDLPNNLISFQNKGNFAKDDVELPLLTLEEAEVKLIEQTLKRNNGSKIKTAKELGISERVLRYKLKMKNILFSKD